MGEKPMAHLSWTEDMICVEGVCECGFTVERHGHDIPGVVWYPAASAHRRPLVLMGHGGVDTSGMRAW
jgi:hypothetical protein